MSQLIAKASVKLVLPLINLHGASNGVAYLSQIVDILDQPSFQMLVHLTTSQ